MTDFLKSAPIAGATLVVHDAERRRSSRVGDFFEMTKPRLSLMSVISAVIGYLAATPARDIPLFLSVLAGTALAAGGAAALNEWMERREDALMRRTSARPIPAGLIAPRTALVYGLLLSAAGTFILWAGANGTAAALAAATLISYLLIYTPLKKRSPWAAEVGAVPGAIPPLIGWTAATGGFGFLGWFLFGVLFTWQMTHFMAISWNCREDYRRGGFRTLSVIDPEGARVSRRAALFAILLVLVTLAPAATGHTGPLYLLCAPLVSLWFLLESLGFHRARPKDRAARRLFFASIVHLPVFLLILVADRFFF